MSYMRAWTLVHTMNECFTRPLVRTLRRCGAGGHAQLTGNGRVVLALYQRLLAESLRGAQPLWSQIARRIKK